MYLQYQSSAFLLSNNILELHNFVYLDLYFDKLQSPKLAKTPEEICFIRFT